MPDQSFKRRSRFKRQERGAALVLFMLMLVLVVLPLIGLAIDGGMLYLAHQRLMAATDAAALAGARSLNIGLTVDAQAANVQSIATQYFNANFPPGYLNSTSASVTVPPPVQSSYHTVTVQVQSSAVVKLYFMGLINHPTANITASASTSRRDVNVVLALDRSGSMDSVCSVLKSDAENFVSKFVNGRDTVGLVTFMGNASVDYASTKNFMPGLNNALAKLQCGGNTGSAAALHLAQQQITTIAEPGALNVIVFFTDGVPNGFLPGLATPSATYNGFPLLPGNSCTGTSVPNGYLSNGGGLYSPNPQAINSTSTPLLSACPSGNLNQLSKYYAYVTETDAFGDSASGYMPVRRDSNNYITFTAPGNSAGNSDAVSTNAADDAARKIRAAGTIIYTIGLGSNGGVDSTFLERVANDTASPIYDPSLPTGKYYYSPNAGQLGAAFNSIASEILRISQ